MQRIVPALLMLFLAGCGERPAAPAQAARPAAAPAVAAVPPARTPSVTVSADASADAGLNWDPPQVQLTAETARVARRDAAAAVREGRL